MGGKSRKTGGISRQLIEKAKNWKPLKKDTEKKTKEKKGGRGLFEE